MKTQLISFYADIEGRKYYSESARRLALACESFDIPFNIRPLESKGNYRLNCLHKPRFIMNMMNEFDSSVLWIDVDSTIHKPLNEFDTLEGFDVVGASFYRTMSSVRASPLYFANTGNARRFLSAWIDETDRIQQSNIQVFDHEALLLVFRKFRRSINIRFLGVEYCAWPGTTSARTYITMGLTDSASKKAFQRASGVPEAMIEWLSPGNAVRPTR